MRELGATIEDLPSRMDFDQAQANFYNAARDGLARALHLARRRGGDRAAVRARPAAPHGRGRPRARRASTPRTRSSYLGVVEQRVRSLHTGCRWVLHSLADMKAKGSPGEHLTALVAATIARQRCGRVVAEWERARLDEVPARERAGRRSRST